MAQNIHVFVRVRPMGSQEEGPPAVTIPAGNPHQIQVGDQSFNFNQAFGPDATQLEIYRVVTAPLVPQVLLGYSCTIFAYGQTGSGKTKTMEGSLSNTCDQLWDSDGDMGITPRSFAHIFEAIKDLVCKVRVSYVEIYEEGIYDLLSAQDDHTKLDQVYGVKCITIPGLIEIEVLNCNQVSKLLARGSRKRRTAPTNSNSRSSRSHSIFTISVLTEERLNGGKIQIKIGKLNLVDLAGSENIGISGAVLQQAREAGVNNQSLVALGRVITAINDKAPHIPYRESLLTRILADSLGGGTRTAMIATISPVAANIEQSINTLRYAQNAKNIKNRPRVNITKEISSKSADDRTRAQLVACLERERNLVIDKENLTKENQNLRDIQQRQEVLLQTVRCEREETLMRVNKEQAREIEKLKEQIDRNGQQIKDMMTERENDVRKGKEAVAQTEERYSEQIQWLEKQLSQKDKECSTRHPDSGNASQGAVKPLEPQAAGLVEELLAQINTLNRRIASLEQPDQSKCSSRPDSGNVSEEEDNKVDQNSADVMDALVPRTLTVAIQKLPPNSLWELMRLNKKQGDEINFLKDRNMVPRSEVVYWRATSKEQAKKIEALEVIRRVNWYLKSHRLAPITYLLRHTIT